MPNKEEEFKLFMWCERSADMLLARFLTMTLYSLWMEGWPDPLLDPQT